MNTNHLPIAFFLLFLAACTESQPTQNQSLEANQLSAEQPATTAQPTTPMYVGDFEAVDFDANKNISYTNKITIAIESTENGVVKGFSVVAGNSRPFTGTYTETGNTLSAVAKEPGDDKYDGVFTFQMHRDSQTITGTWKANDRKLGVTKRKFNLKKRVFKYDPTLEMQEKDVIDEGGFAVQFYQTLSSKEGDPDYAEIITADALKFNASKTLLRKEDVENMHKGDLEVIRNAIYARHGYSFQNRRMRYVFDRVDWFMPVSTNISLELTDLEKKNIDLLKRYEQHAERYYDSFGR